MPLLILLTIALVVGISFNAVQHGGTTKILIGSLVLIIIGLIDQSNLGTVMLFGILCTAGLGLIPFFIIAWIIGSVVMFIVDAIRGSQKNPALAVAGASAGKKAAAKKQAQEATSSVPQDLLALNKYVTEARESGIVDWEITRRLKKQGWSEDQIKSALKS